MTVSLLMFFGIAFMLVFLLRTLKIGTMLGFLLAGVIAGPYVMGLFHISEIWGFLGEIGIIFMWFTIGLELSVRRLWKMRKTIFGFGAAQVLTVVVMLFPILFGLTSWSIMGTIMVALLLASSSTTGDLQILADRNELQTTLGRQTFSILLFQALLAIPILAMLPIFAGKSFNLGAEVIDVLVLSFGLILGVMTVGRFIINPLLRRVTRLKSKEVFLMAVMLSIIVCVVGMDFIGLPPSMGAFLAGMILSETIFRHQIQTDIAPYQMLFLSFFFIALGMGINLSVIWTNWWIIALGVAMVMSVKFAAIFMVARVRNVPPRQSVLIALILSQCGEFGLLILQTMKINGIQAIPFADGEILMAIIIISMMATPLLVALYDRLYKSGRLVSDAVAKKVNVGRSGEKISVIICGFGRVGQTIAKMLESQGISYAAVDMNVDEVVAGRDAGFNVFYGDTTNEGLLREMGLAPRKVKAVIVALDNAAVAKRTVRAVRRAAPRVKIFARARNMDEASILMEEGAKMALPETVESSFMLGQQVLQSLGVNDKNINEMMHNMRDGNYKALAEILKK